jgi:hypothetical protein
MFAHPTVSALAGFLDPTPTTGAEAGDPVLAATRARAERQRLALQRQRRRLPH